MRNRYYSTYFQYGLNKIRMPQPRHECCIQRYAKVPVDSPQCALRRFDSSEIKNENHEGSQCIVQDSYIHPFQSRSSYYADTVYPHTFLFLNEITPLPIPITPGCQSQPFRYLFFLFLYSFARCKHSVFQPFLFKRHCFPRDYFFSPCRLHAIVTQGYMPLTLGADIFGRR